MSLYLVTPLIQTFFGILLIPIVLKGHLRSLVHRLFSLYLLGLALWGFFIFAMRASPNLEQAYFWEKTLMAVLPFMWIIFFYFTVVLTALKVRKWLLLSAWSIAFLFALLARTEIIVSGMRSEFFGYAAIGGPLLVPLVIYGYTMMIWALLKLRKARRISANAEERNRSAYIMIGLLFFFIFGLFDIFPLLGLPMYPGAIFGNIVFCLFTSIAIVKYHLLDIYIVIRRGAAYILMSAAVAIPYVGIILLFNLVFHNSMPTWVYIVLLLLLALGLQPVWGRIQRSVDRLFYRERYDFLKALINFSLDTHRVDNFSEIGSSLVKLISMALRSSSVYLLLPSKPGDFYMTSHSGTNSSQFNLSKRSPILTVIHSNKKLLRKEDLNNIYRLQSLTAEEADKLEKIQAEIIVPIITREDELVGILVLAKKLSEQPYSYEEEQLILTVANRVAIELENTQLYEAEKMMREELEKLDEQKTEFLHNIAHELKTPLTAILSSSELADKKSISDSDLKKRLIKNIRNSAESMNRRVSELLDLAQTQIGEIRIELKLTEIGEMLNQAVSQLQILFQMKEQVLLLEIPKLLPKVNADQEKLEQVLFNLLSNANKFSPTGSNVTLRAKEMNKKIFIEVEDSAPSLSEKEKERLFNPYYRGEDVEKRQRFSGLGLGLAISKKLVELHKGEIWVESKPGKGNVFAVSLPISD